MCVLYVYLSTFHLPYSVKAEDFLVFVYFVLCYIPSICSVLSRCSMNSGWMKEMFAEYKPLSVYPLIRGLSTYPLSRVLSQRCSRFPHFLWKL